MIPVKIHFKIVEMLRDMGIKATYDQESFELLLYACKHNLIEIVKTVVEHESIDYVNDHMDRFIYLHECLNRKNYDIFRYLVESGASVNATDYEINTPLHLVAEHYEFAKLLIEHGSDVNADNIYDETPLYLATEHHEVVKLLIENGADVNHRNNESETPMYEACYKGTLDSVLVLIGAGAETVMTNKYGQTPLHILAKRNCMTSSDLKAQYFLGNDVNTRDVYYKTALMSACSNNSHKYANMLISLGANVNDVDKNGINIFQESICVSGVEIIRVLINSGKLEEGIINTKINNMGLPIHVALRRRRYEIVKLLLDNGSEYDTLDESGNSPLRIACKFGVAAGVKLLLDHGANDTIENLEDMISCSSSLIKSYVNERIRKLRSRPKKKAITHH